MSICPPSCWWLNGCELSCDVQKSRIKTISVDMTSTALKLFVLHLLIHEWHRQANSIDNKQCINLPLKSPSQVQWCCTTLTTTSMKSTSQSIDNNHVHPLINKSTKPFIDANHFHALINEIDQARALIDDVALKQTWASGNTSTSMTLPHELNVN